MPETKTQTQQLTTATLEQIPTVKEIVEPVWAAIIYRPKKEQTALEDIEDVDPQDYRKPLPTYVRQIMLPPDKSNTLSFNSPDWIELRPGTNLQVRFEDWQRALQMRLVQALVGVSIDVVATSIKDSESPTYSNFTAPEAIRLVKLTTATAWIDEWMSGETRTEVIRAADERKAFLEKELAKRTA